MNVLLYKSLFKTIEREQKYRRTGNKRVKGISEKAEMKIFLKVRKKNKRKFMLFYQKISFFRFLSSKILNIYYYLD